MLVELSELAWEDDSLLAASVLLSERDLARLSELLRFALLSDLSRFLLARTRLDADRLDELLFLLSELLLQADNVIIISNDTPIVANFSIYIPPKIYFPKYPPVLGRT